MEHLRRFGTKRALKTLALLWGGQAGNYALTLLAIPYLIQVLGLERYGAFVLLQSTLLFGQVLIEYGFPILANREAALCRGSREALQRLSSAVLILRLGLWCVSAAILTGQMIWFNHGGRIDRVGSVLGMVGLLGVAFFPQWILVGLGRAVQVGWMALAWRALGILGIFLFVHGPSDFALAVGCFYLPSIGQAVLGMEWLRRLGGFPGKVEPESVRSLVLEGGSIFFATLGTMLYSTWNLVHLGRIGSLEEVGAYGAAEKVVRVIAGASAPVVQAILPRFARRATDSVERSERALLEMSILTSLAGGGIVAFAVFLAAPMLAVLLSRSEGAAIAAILARLGPVLALILPGIVVSHLGLLARGDSRFWMGIALGVGGVNIIALPVLCSLMGALEGTLVSTYVCEALVLFGCLIRYAVRRTSHV